jgi:hypothetical protein
VNRYDIDERAHEDFDLHEPFADVGLAFADHGQVVAPSTRQSVHHS